MEAVESKLAEIVHMVTAEPEIAKPDHMRVEAADTSLAGVRHCLEDVRSFWKRHNKAGLLLSTPLLDES